MLARLQTQFRDRLRRLRASSYRNLLALAMARRRLFVFGFLGAVAVSLLLVPFLGEISSPPWIPARSPCMPARPPARASRTPPRSWPRSSVRSAASFPAPDLDAIIDNIGLNQSPINLIYNNSGTIGLQDGDIFISLKPGPSPPPPIMSAPCAKGCRAIFPEVTFSFPPADIVSQILNFGAPAPIDVQVTGTDRDTDRRLSPSASCARCARSRHWSTPACSSPTPSRSCTVDADRSRIAQVGLTEQNVTSALATALAGTGTTAPNFWLNPKNDVSYNMTAQTPEYQTGLAGRRCRTCR